MLFSIKKSWFFFVRPVIAMLLLFWIGQILYISMFKYIGVFILIWAILRFYFDKIIVSDTQLISRQGIIFIDSKTIPLKKISLVSAKTDIFSEIFKFGTIEIQSSAFKSTITYPYIDNIHKEVDSVNNMIDKITNISDI